jgi:hypothetical protein
VLRDCKNEVLRRRLLEEAKLTAVEEIMEDLLEEVAG